MSCLLDFRLYFLRSLESAGAGVKNLPFMQSPLPVLVLLAIYLFFTFKYGPEMMKNKEPYEIKHIIFYYNVIQICLNILGILTGILVVTDSDIFCMPVGTPRSLILPHYLYFLLKGLDLLDTVFFVLRKKNQQITFLHVYHHILMFLGGWFTCRYFPAGQLFFLGFFNVVVHTFMYVYYLITSHDLSNKDNIWWKKHLTQFQIVQHCFVFISFTIPLLNPNCSYPKWFLASALPGVALMIYLFIKFYQKAYGRHILKSQ